MSERKPLHLGVAYHGNRMPHHASEDLLDMAKNGMDIVVHMLSHTDWRRHLNVMKDLVDMSTDAGLTSWIDNWGLAGSPGDASHFLAYYPEAHAIYSNGDHAGIYPCLNSPEYRRFTHEWIDAVEFIGGKTIFWDEPHMPTKKTDDKTFYACACPRCRKLFEEKYQRPMPEQSDADVAAFAADTIADYFADATAYSHEKGMINTVCVMLGTYGMSLSTADRIAALPYMENIGSDPYWIGKKKKDPTLDVYDFVRRGTEENLALCERFGKDHNIWIQTYSNPRGQEEDIIEATDAAYDAGARTILAWGYYGSESNNYRAENPAVTWAKTCEAFARVRNRERDYILEEKRKKYKA